MSTFELVVIGGGSGGLIAAEYAAKLGAKVALVEKLPYLGGDCLNDGCVPSKALIHAAKRYFQSAHSSRFGVHGQPAMDFEEIQDSVNKAITRIRDRSENDKHFEKKGVKVFHGLAKFIGPDSIEVEGKKITGKKFIIATGSRPRLPEIKGIENIDVYTNENIFNIHKKPDSLAVLGGGVIGCEIGCAYNFLDTKIHIFERYDHLSLRVDKEISEFVTSKFTERKMDIYTNSDVVEIKKNGKKADVFFVHGKSRKRDKITVDAMFVAIGRIPNTDLDLYKAGVDFDQRGIKIDRFGRTSNKRIWAVGDVTGKAGFTHVAAEQGYYAAVHALFGIRHQVSLHALPYVIFTRPEVAHVGKTEKQLKDEGIYHVVRKIDYKDIDRAMIEDKPGMIKVMLDKKDRLLGATVAGSQASEQIAMFVLAMSKGLTMRDIASAILPYPTYAIAPKTLAANHLLDKVLKYDIAHKAMKAMRLLQR